MNILTIDFDWIMGDIIETYNGEISANEDYDTMWNSILLHSPGINYWPNYQLYQEIKDICTIYKNKLYKIKNHHDYYSLNGFSYNCGNWVKWLYQHKMFKDYIWIPNTTSQLNLIDENDLHLLTVPPYPREALFRYKIDQVFLCQSPEWLSPQANELWELWTSTLEKKKKK